MKYNTINKYPFLTKEVFEADYKELKTLPAIAKKYNLTLGIIKYIRKQLGVVVDRSCGKSKYTVNENIFNYDNEVGFYVAGFAAADGNIFHDKRSNTSMFCIGLAKKDREHLTKIKNAIEFSGPILDYEYDVIRPSCRMAIYCSKPLIKDLAINFNVVPRKTFIYEFPERLINHSMVNHFIRGYFDGDGCFYVNKKNMVTFELLGTKLFLESVQLILERECELNSKIIVRKIKNIYRLRYSAKNMVSKICKFLYKDSNILLQRKWDKIKHLL
jgi:hypothetical protein